MAGDFNGDGRTDLAVANAGANDVSVLLGNGDGTFQTQVTYAVGSAPVALVAGDFNGDGRTDLAVANDGSNDVSVLLGNGDGTFQTQVTYAVGSVPDRPRGGRLQRRRPDRPGRRQRRRQRRVGAAGQRRRHLPGPGDLRGGDRARSPSWRATSTATAGTDLAVANYGANDVSVLLGNGDGTFQAQVTYAVGTVPRRPRGGRLQRRRPDRPGRRQLRRQRRVGAAGQRRRHLPGRRSTYAVGTGPIALVAGDFNGDGRTDLAVANDGSNDVSVLLGNGDGTFQAQVTYAVGSVPIALVAGDFNGDGRTDLAVANYGSNDVSVLLGNGDGTFQTQVTYAVGTAPTALVTGDFNGDGRTDLAVANCGRQRRVGAAGQRRRHLPGPGDLRGGVRARSPSWRATSTATAGPTWPPPTSAPTTCRCC